MAIDLLKRVFASCAVTIALALPAVSVKAQPAAPALTTVRVAGTVSDELTPMLYAQKSGMYAKAGLDVQFVASTSGAAVSSAVIAGAFEIGKSSLLSLMNAHLRGLPLAIIGGSGQYDPKSPYAQMVVAADSPFASAKDLNGKTIAVPALNDLNVLAADLWIDKNGGDSRTVKFIEIPNSTAGAAVIEKRTDAAVMMQPYLTDAVEAKTVKQLGPAYGAISNSFLITAWFVSTDWATKHPDVVKAFIDVTDRAAAYTNAHHAETAPLVADITKIPLAVINKMPRSVSSTSLHLSDIQPLIDGAAKYKLIPQAFPARDLLWSGDVREVEMMIATDIATERAEVAVKDGTIMPAYIARPVGAVDTPGILVLQDQFGVTDFLQETADRFARLGFTAIAPALYHRTGAYGMPYSGGYDANKPHHKGVTFEGQIADAEAAFDWLVREAGVANDRIGAMGFCMGGRLAYLTNAHRPLRAAISFYGGRIAPDLLRYAERQHGPLLFFWGGRDTVIPKEQYRAVADGLDAAGVTHDQVVFSAAGHAFFAHTRADTYHERSSHEAWSMSLELLRAQGVYPA